MFETRRFTGTECHIEHVAHCQSACQAFEDNERVITLKINNQGNCQDGICIV
jgi:hypothetical protein